MAKKNSLGTFSVLQEPHGITISVKEGSATAASFLPEGFTLDDLATKLTALYKNATTAKPKKSKLSINLNKEIISLDGKITPLLGKEVKLLRYFSENCGKIVTREELLENVWGKNSNSTTRTLDVHISRLRQKMGDYGDVPSVIQTVRGIGYKFVPPAKFEY